MSKYIYLFVVTPSITIVPFDNYILITILDLFHHKKMIFFTIREEQQTLMKLTLIMR